MTSTKEELFRMEVMQNLPAIMGLAQEIASEIDEGLGDKVTYGPTLILPALTAAKLLCVQMGLTDKQQNDLLHALLDNMSLLRTTADSLPPPSL